MLLAVDNADGRHEHDTYQVVEEEAIVESM